MPITTQFICKHLNKLSFAFKCFLVKHLVKLVITKSSFCFLNDSELILTQTTISFINLVATFNLISFNDCSRPNLTFLPVMVVAMINRLKGIFS